MNCFVMILLNNSAEVSGVELTFTELRMFSRSLYSHLGMALVKETLSPEWLQLRQPK